MREKYWARSSTTLQAHARFGAEARRGEQRRDNGCARFVGAGVVGTAIKICVDGITRFSRTGPFGGTEAVGGEDVFGQHDI